MATGNSGLLNKIKGVTSVLALTDAEKASLAECVLPAHILVADSDNILYLTDGTSSIKNLDPIVAASKAYAVDSQTVHTTGDETIAGTKTFSAAIVGSVTGNAGSATKLATARTINGTSFNGTANITTANWGTARDITIADSTGDNTGEAVSVNGSAAVTLKLPATIKASLDGNAATATSATTATNATNAAKLDNIASSGYVQTGNVNQTIDGTKTFSAAIVGSVTGNAGSATKLATARTINGTSFDGTANITTANWGTARNISITDGTNTSTAVSVNGSANVSLKLPATIEATFVGNITGNVTGNCSGSSGSCTGNAASATKLQTARSLWGNNFDGSQNLSGDIHFTNDDLTGVVVGARGQVGDNDFWRVGGGATASNSGFMELATADDGDEPIYVRQYTGVYATIRRTATLLDASGNTQFPGTVTATGLTVTGDANFANITASYITGLFTE